MKRARALFICLVAVVGITLVTGRADSSDGVVRAVLFYSPACLHCHTVLERVLPPLLERHGARLQVVPVNTATPAGLALYKSTLDRFSIIRGGVPLLVVGDEFLIGSDQIPTRFPAIIEQHLTAGGVSWSTVPGLAAAMESALPLSVPTARPEASAEPMPHEPPPEPESALPVEAPAEAVRPSIGEKAASTPAREIAPILDPNGREKVTIRAEATPVPATAPLSSPVVRTLAPAGAVAVWERIQVDPYGNALAIVVLVAMIGAALWSFSRLSRPSVASHGDAEGWLSPLLAVAGIAVAAYLAQVEVRDVEAVCGPVGDCNTVQQSEYARLFGVVPIGVMGVIGFALVLGTSLARRVASHPLRSWLALAELVMTSSGLLFSIYLTFLEPFVIGATCLWCVSSAVLMTLLHLRSVPHGLRALAILRAGAGSRVSVPAAPRVGRKA